LKLLKVSAISSPKSGWRKGEEEKEEEGMAARQFVGGTEGSERPILQQQICAPKPRSVFKCEEKWECPLPSPNPMNGEKGND
jgi:hypothetical protein